MQLSALVKENGHLVRIIKFINHSSYNYPVAIYVDGKDLKWGYLGDFEIVSIDKT